MYPLPLIFSSKNTVRSSIPGKPTETKNFEDISERELLCRLVALTQSLRSMVLFFVWIALIQIFGGIILLLQFLK